MMKYNRFCLGLGLIGLMMCVTADADVIIRHHSTQANTEQHRHHHRYYDKAPRTINRPFSQYRKQELRLKPRRLRGETRHHPHIHQQQQGVYFSGYGFIPYGHRHTRQCPEWHALSFVLWFSFSH